MKLIMGCALSALFSFAAFGGPVFNEPDSNNWVKVATSSDGRTFIYVKLGSYVKSKVERSVVVQNFSLNSSDTSYSVSFFKASISNEDCNNKYGKIVFSNLQGKRQFDADYIEDGGSVGSSVAQGLCSLR